MGIWQKIAVVLAVSCIGFLICGTYVFFSPQIWTFALQARTEVITIDLDPDAADYEGTATQDSSRETRWLISNAVICSRETLALKSVSIELPGDACSGRRWKKYQVADKPEATISEDSLVIIQPVSVTIESSPVGGLFMSVESKNSGSLGRLASTEENKQWQLGERILLVWPSRPARDLIFPFSGAITIGRDISWSDNRALRDGQLTVYNSASAEQRKAITETQLMLGDQLRLDASNADGGYQPAKGFVLAKGFAESEQTDTLLNVVAFGRSDSVLIERYGDNGFSFAPSNWAKLVSNELLTTAGSLLAIVVGIVGALEGISGEPAKGSFRRWWRIAITGRWKKLKRALSRQPDL